MTFLNSAILFGLVAVTLPLLIHFFTRSKLRTIRFSSLTFLKELQQQKIRNIKLRQILLLILRTLIVLCLVLAFARPALKGAITAGYRANVKTSAAIILDNSYSMSRLENGHRLFDLAKNKTAEIIDIMKGGDEVFLVPSSELDKENTLRPYHSSEALQKRLQEVEPSFDRYDILEALDQAQQLLSSSHNLNREVYLISDLQKSDFVINEDSTKYGWDEKIKLFILSLGSTTLSNLGIEKIKFNTRILEKGKIAEIEVTVRNYGSQPEQNKLLQLFVNGKRMAQTMVSINVGAASTEVFRFLLERSGICTGYILIEGDDLTADDRRDFVFTVPDGIRVLLVGPDEKDTKVIAYALNPTNDANSVFKIDQGNLNILNAAQLQNADVVVLSDIPSLSSQHISMLRSFLAAGGGLMVFLGKSIDLRAYNGDLRKELNLPLLSETIGKIGRDSPSFSWGKIDYDHPIFTGVFEDEERNLTSPLFYFAVKAAKMKGVDKIIEYSNGAPFLFEKKFGQGSLLFFTTGTDPDLSDMWRRSVFAPLVNRCVMYLSSRSNDVSESMLVGTEISCALPADALSQKLEMKLPDGTRERVQPTLAGKEQRIIFSDTDLPGIYRLTSGETPLRVWALNVDTHESDLKPIDFEILQQRFNAIRISKNENIPALVHSRRFGRELWKYFVLAALFLLVLEMIIYREKGEVVDIVGQD